MKKKALKNKKKTRSYDSFLQTELRDSELAAEYLSAAIQDKSIEGLLIALKNVAEAHGGVTVLSKLTKLNRQSIYKMFCANGNPTISSLVKVLSALGIDLSFRSQERTAA